MVGGFFHLNESSFGKFVHVHVPKCSFQANDTHHLSVQKKVFKCSKNGKVYVLLCNLALHIYYLAQ